MLNCLFEKNISITIVLRKELKCEDTIFAQLEIRKFPSASLRRLNLRTAFDKQSLKITFLFFIKPKSQPKRNHLDIANYFLLVVRDDGF